MKRAFVLVAAGVASAAGAQSLDFELSDPVLRSPGDSTLVTVFVDPGPEDYAVSGALFDVHASEEGWSDTMTLIRRTAAPPIILEPGTIVGGSVTGIVIGQLSPPLGFIPDPGRIPAWSALFTITDATERTIDLRTETAVFQVYTDLGVYTRRSLTPTEGSARIEVIPAPASAALLGLGAMAASRRRRGRMETRT